jgi:hypothetical protein
MMVWMRETWEGKVFFWRGGVRVLLGFLRKTVRKTWFFDGKSVVERW